MKKKGVRFIGQVGGGIVFPLAICLFFVALLSPRGAPALDSAALPAGGEITSGSGSISTSGNRMTVNQTTPKMVADWDTFNIGQDASVTFSQPDASASALNRIHDQNPSQILGSLNANGRVFLVNPSGIIFGASAQVNVGGLVASSLNITDEDFLSGNYTFASNGSAGSISNAGTIDAEGGYVAFLAPVIENTGSVTADGGTVAMAAGSKISLDFAGDGLITYTIDQGDVDAQVENKGLIRADGGLVYLSAEAADELTRAAVNNEGIIQAQTLREVDGRILLMGDMETGEVQVAGTLDASAPNGGDGGFIETSAAKVSIDDSVSVTTMAADGETGTWLIDPTDYTIAASGGDMTGAALTTALASTDVTIETADTGADAGNITVNDTISWSANTLTLDADNDIEINAELFGSANAQLALYYGQGAAAAGNTSTYTVNAAVNLGAGQNFFTKLGSDGSEITYTVITTLGNQNSVTGTDLQGINGNLSGKYALGSNIDAMLTADDTVWLGGEGFDPISTFTGTFDGLGHTITGLYINRPSENYVGLFGVCTDAVIRNVGLIGSSITGDRGVGGLVARATGTITITNSYSTGDIEGSQWVAGLVGQNLSTATITNCYTTGTVTGTTYYAGGLVGWHTSGTISDSYSTAVVEGNDNVGGLVGYNSSGSVTITDSYATGDVQGASFVGGLVGNHFAGTITDSYATGAVTGYDSVGGLAGSNDDDITNSYATGSVTGTESVGGLVGYNHSGSTISSSYATGAVTADSMYIGGLVGFNDGTITNSYSISEISSGDAMSSIGGLAGVNTGTVEGSYATGNVTITSFMSWYVGGLVGDNIGGTITDSYATNMVSGDTYIGGLAGANFEGGTIEYSYATGSVNGTTWVGGLVGQNYISTITGCYAEGDVSGSSTGWNDGYVGGLVGYNENGSSIENSYATGSVSNTYTDNYDYHIGGLVGYNDEYSSITNTYAVGSVSDSGTGTGTHYLGALVGYNHENDPDYGTITTGFYNTSITTDASGGLGGGSTSMVSDLIDLSDTEMMQASSFSSYIDISNAGGSSAVWRIYEDHTYPLLRYFLTEISTSNTIKTYDGIASISGQDLPWNISVDSSLIFGDISYASANVGAYTLDLSDLYSSQQGYDIVSSGSETLTVNAKELTISGTTAADKTYDGSTTASITAGTLSGLVSGETLGVSATGTFDSANAGTRSASATYTLSDGSGLAGNYTLADTTGHTATINQAAITISTVDVTKTYDGTTIASGTATVTSVSLCGSDTISGGTFSFTDGNAGTGKTVSVSGVGVTDGNGGNNYAVTYAANTSSTITPALLSITARDYSKDYDGTAYSGGNGVTYSGFVNGEDMSVLSGTLTYSGTSQGAMDAGTYVITASGLASGNYDITFVNGELTILPMVPDSDTAGSLPGDVERRQPLPSMTVLTVPNKEDSGSLLDIEKTIVADGETTILSTGSSLLVIDFEYSPGGTVTLLSGGDPKKEPQGVIEALPVFLDERGSRSFVGNYMVQERHGAVSLKRIGEGRSLYEGIFQNVLAIRSQRPFNLTTKDGKSAEFTVGVTKDGVVFIFRSDGDIRHMDRDQVVLMALQTIKQDMGVDLKDIRGLVIVAGESVRQAI
ncbi:GLUG motif-containing protein [uncultured Desulfosarcina sp.]|uniref:beta strand repeat-containing protein n=1 Tax=uncultured Desulfosarcina sp. TaxID=218289 RepID=UPI0029C81160|nr:GLUG motif-containing protein [uncultured Desulfosarcina sp.]